jgi:hypothetical protein
MDCPMPKTIGDEKASMVIRFCQIHNKQDKCADCPYYPYKEAPNAPKKG